MNTRPKICLDCLWLTNDICKHPRPAKPDEIHKCYDGKGIVPDLMYHSGTDLRKKNGKWIQRKTVETATKKKK